MRFLTDRNGGVAVTFALALIVMLGFAGLAVEVGNWLLVRRFMQGAADVAAASAAVAYDAGATDYTTQGKGTAAQNGWTDGTNGVTVAVNAPPTAGTFNGVAGYIEVLISQAQAPWFSGFWNATGPTIRAHAVAKIGAAGGGCMLALGTANNSLQVNGNGVVSAAGCGVDSNGGIAFGGNHSTITAGSVTVDTSSVNCPSSQCMAPAGKVKTSTTTSDPYSNRSFTTPAGCDHTGLSVSSTQTLNPGTYCNGLSVSGGNITLASGIYYIKSGSFSLNGGGTIQSAAGGVTIVLTNGGTGSPTYAEVNVGGNGSTVACTGAPGGQATLCVQALTTGTTAGLVFFGDRNAPSTNVNTFAGNGVNSMDGALYFPTQEVDIAGNGVAAAPCTQLIALTIKDTGNGAFANGCSGLGTANIGGSATRLVE